LAALGALLAYDDTTTPPVRFELHGWLLNSADQTTTLPVLSTLPINDSQLGRDGLAALVGATK
jgi:hypothetical protein